MSSQRICKSVNVRVVVFALAAVLVCAALIAGSAWALGSACSDAYPAAAQNAGATCAESNCEVPESCCSSAEDAVRGIVRG